MRLGGAVAPLSDEDPIVVEQKRAAARAAAELVRGRHARRARHGTHRRPPAAGARRARPARTCAAWRPPPPPSRRRASSGCRSQPLDAVGELDIAIDGADQVDPAGWLVKGGGGAHTREKIVAAAAARFVVIVSAEKAVAAAARRPCPSSCSRFGVEHTLASARRPRGCATGPPSPDGGLIADYLGPVGDPRELAARLSATPGVVEHGLFAPEMVSVILIAGEDGVERRAGSKPDVL